MASEAIPIPPDENRGPEILAICGTLVALSVIIVTLRIWVRARIIRQVGIDDWTIIAATVTIFVEMMIIIPEVYYGAGRHVQYIDPPSNIVKGLHLNFVTQPLCLIALCFTKVSVGFFLLRITPSQKFRWFIIGTIIFTILSATGNFLTVFFQCQPLAFTWGGVTEGKCMEPANLKFAAFFNSSVAVLTDVVFALLPIPMLWNVQMNWRIKMALGAILSLGVFAAVAAVVKITFITNYGKHGDFLWDSSDLTIWTTVEICTAIIAACFPCLKPLFRTLFDSSSRGTNSSSERYGSKYKGYIRNTDKTGATAKTKKGSANKSITPFTDPEAPPQFELYSRGNKYTSDVKVGAWSAAGAEARSGSEESILHMHVPTPEPHAGPGITRKTDVFVSSTRP